MKKGLISKLLTALLLVGLLFSILPSQQAQAADLCVNQGGTDGCHSTIQAAINAAETGNVITVQEGTYVGDLLLTKPITLQGTGDTTIIEGDIRYQSEDFIPGTMTLKNVMVVDSAAAFRMGVRRVGKFDKVVIDNVTMTANYDHTNRAISFDTVSSSEVEGDTPTLNSLTIKNSRVHSTLAVYLTGTVGEIDIQNNDFYITKIHWGAYNAININQYPGVPAGVYSITNNRIHLPNTSYGYATAITNQGVEGLKDQYGGNELIASGNTIQVGSETPDADQSTFILDKVANTNALFTVINQRNNARYSTIQAAIDAAESGDTILVGARTYAEDLEIGKSITLLGPNDAISPNTGTRVAEAIINPTNEVGKADPAVLITAPNISVTLKGLTFDMSGTTDESDRFVELVNKTGVTMDVQNNQFLNAPSCINGNWYITGTTDPFSLTLKDNYFHGSKDSNGISLWGKGQTVDIQDNVWKDNGGWAVNFNFVTGTFANNQILDTEENGPNWSDEQGGFLFASENHLTLTGNLFDGLTNPSIRIYESFSGELNATGNIFSNTEDSTVGVIRINDGANLSGINFEKNHFLNNPMVVQNLDVAPLGTPLNVASNWWGVSTGPAADINVGPFSYIPWCTNPECDTFDGPVYNQTMDTYHATIQGAIDAAGDNNTILVSPGTFNEAITLDKIGLTVKSTAGAGTTFINTPAGTPRAVGFADNLGTVTFEGFTVQGFTSAGIVQGFASVGTTVNIIDNIVKPTGYYTTNLIQVVGEGSVVSGNRITGSGNPHPHHDGAGNTAIMVMNGSNISITDNVIDGSLADRLGLDQAIVIWNFSNPSGIPMSNIQITGNTVTNVNWLLNFMEKDENHKVGLVSIEKNKFTDQEGIIWDDFARDISRNWWGSPAGPDSELIIGDDVIYSPWCANEECTEFLPAEVTISPVDPIVCGVTANSTIEIKVAGIPTSTPIQGYQFRLNFDPSKTSIADLDVDIVNGGFIADGGLYIINYVDENGAYVTGPTGILEIAYTRLTPSTSIGDGKLVSVTLTHLGVGAAGAIEFTLSDLLLSDRNGFVIPAEVESLPTSLTLEPSVMNTTKTLGYCDLASAVAAADAGDNIQLLVDIAIPATVTVDKALTLDLNGKVATYSTTDNSYALKVDGTNAALTVKDSSTEGTGKILVVNSNAALQGRGISVINGSLTLESGTIVAPYAAVYVQPGASMVMNGGHIQGLYGIIILGPDSSLDINDGTIEATYFAVSGNGTAGYGGTTITIDGGTLTSTEAAAIYNPQDGTLTITDGTITGYNGIEMKSGNLLVNGGTIMGKGAFVSPLPNDNGTANSGDAILLNGRDAYTGDITLNITGGTISAAYGYAVRDHSADDQALKTSDVEITGGSFYGGASVTEPVTFSTKFVALHEASTDPLLRLLPGGLYNTDPAKSVYVPYGTKMNSEGAMWEVYQLTLSVRDFFYNTEHVVDPPRDQWLRGVSANFDANFLFSEAKSVLVELFTGTDDLLQSNLLIAPSAHPGNSLSTSFDFFGDYTTTKWTNVRDVEYGQTAAPTFVRISVEFPNGTLTAISLAPTGDRSTILPGVSGLITLQGILNPKAGVPVTLTSGGVVLNASSTALPLINYSFTGVETLTYTITTSQPRYLNLTSASAKFILVDGDKVLNPLRLFGGDVNQDNEIGVGDSGLVGTSWGSTANPEANINYDGIVNIQDLAMVGGNYGLTSATAYTSWVPLQ